jgi:ADP-ribose pyrophosphatase YjhB (NUDIX family)
MHLMMKYQTDVNEVQGLIMRQLYLHDELRFSEINTDGFPSDQFSYHLRQLIKYGIVEKSDKGRYTLSVAGRSRAIMLDTKTNKFIEQGYVACRVLLAREHSGTRQYLMQRRARVPFQGYICEPGGKVLFGEDIAAAAKRNMLAETGLECDMLVRGIVHLKDDYRSRIVQDKYFFMVRATNPRGTLLKKGGTGENMWMTLEQIAASSKVHQSVADMIHMTQQDNFGFLERTHVVDEY